MKNANVKTVALTMVALALYALATNEVSALRRLKL